MKGVNVEILGQNLLVASDGGDEWAKALATTVDDKIKKIRANTQQASTVSLAILAALNFADELERLRREHQDILDRIEALNLKLSEATEERRP